MSLFDYTLGFVVADGCLTESPKGTPRLMMLSTDEQIIRDLGRLWGLKEPTCQRSVRLTEKPVWRVAKADLGFVEPFLKAGLVRRKTYEQGPLNVSREGFGDFLRGYTDGDGHIAMVGYSPSLLYPSSAPRYLTWLEERMKGMGWNPLRKRCSYGRRNWETLRLRAGDTRKALDLCGYRDREPVLFRKKEVALRAMDGARRSI